MHGSVSVCLLVCLLVWLMRCSFPYVVFAYASTYLLVTCVLSGCDYLESIKGIGFKKAHKLVYENGQDVKNLFKKIRREGKHQIPINYEKTFEMALLTFKFQRVYDPERKEIVHLNDPETHELGPLLKNYTDLDFLGAELDNETANKIAECVIDPISRENLKDMIFKKEEEDRILRTQRTFIRNRKNN